MDEAVLGLAAGSWVFALLAQNGPRQRLQRRARGRRDPAHQEPLHRDEVGGPVHLGQGGAGALPLPQHLAEGCDGDGGLPDAGHHHQRRRRHDLDPDPGPQEHPRLLHHGRRQAGGGGGGAEGAQGRDRPHRAADVAGIPLAPHLPAAGAALDKLPKATQDRLVQLGLARPTITTPVTAWSITWARPGR